MGNSLIIEHYDGTWSEHEFPRDGFWRINSHGLMIKKASGDPNRTVYPWQSIKRYSIVKEEQHEQRPTALVIGSEGGHVCFGRIGHSCDVCGYPESSRHYGAEVGGPGDVLRDAVERGAGSAGKPDAGAR